MKKYEYILLLFFTFFVSWLVTSLMVGYMVSVSMGG